MWEVAYRLNSIINIDEEEGEETWFGATVTKRWISAFPFNAAIWGAPSCLAITIIISFHVIFPVDKCHCHHFADEADRHYLDIRWPESDLNSNLSVSKNFDSYLLKRERNPRHRNDPFPSVPQSQVHVFPLSRDAICLIPESSHGAQVADDDKSHAEPTTHLDVTLAHISNGHRSR